MKQVNGFWLPDSEKHLVPFVESGPRFAGGATYQLHKLLAALPYVRKFRHAVDVGGHCGLWSRPLSVMFDKVTAFEPVQEHRECFVRNVAAERVTLHPVALGAQAKAISLHSGPASSGDTYVQDGGEHSAEMRPLDAFALEMVDFLKIDCEGYELFVLKGGEQTIRKCKPCIVVEQKPGKGRQLGLGDIDAVKLLMRWGAEHVWTISGDYCLRWK